MNILYTIDNNYFPQIFVSIKSLLKYNESLLDIFIVTEDLKLENKKAILGIADASNANIHFMRPPQIEKSLKVDRGSKSQYYRLFIDDIFRGIDIDKIVFLDADTMITSKNFFDIFELDMKGNTIGACIDPWGKKYRNLFNLNSDMNMFNSGVLLIDVNAWIKRDIAGKMRSLINNRTEFYQGDQGLLNQLFQGHFLVLKPNYNLISSYFELSYNDLMIYRKPVNFYSKKELETAVNNPLLVHFTSTFLHTRPWEGSQEHPYCQKWHYLAKGDHVSLSNMHFKNINFLRILYKILPNRLGIHLLGFLQAYLRPTWQRWKIH